MKLKVWLTGVVMAAALLQVGVVYAAKMEVVVKADNKDDCAAVAAAIQKQMSPGGHYEFVTSKERSDINARLAEMQSIFDKYNTVAQMDQASKTRLFNDQEAVNATLNRRSDDRLVCASEKPLGSNIPRTTCRTYRQVEEARRQSQQMKDRWNQTSQPMSGG
jgi:hypothetical protein